MTDFHKKIYRQGLKIIFIIMLMTVMSLAFCACGDPGDSDKGRTVKESTVATDDIEDDKSGGGTELTDSSNGDSSKNSEVSPGSGNSQGGSTSGGVSGGTSSGGSSGGTTSGDIGAAKAKSIALAKVPGATSANIAEFEREYDDGRLEYEGSIYYNGYEYEFEIDGTTGTILKWEIDD